MKISIVVLTYNRRDRLERQLQLLAELSLGEKELEIIVVDNASEKRVDDLVSCDPRVKFIRNEENLGAVGRNRGMQAATGDIVVTLDDDVYGITDDHIRVLTNIFISPEIAAVNFKVIEEGTNRIANWCHPYVDNLYHDKEFETSGISEGAVAFRRAALQRVGYYPNYFFISHEGADLAYRLMNGAWRIVYSPRITVTHAYEERGRPSWRRYYYDTRNQLWLVMRNYPFKYGFKKLSIGWSSMLVYSVRDGYFRYWLKAVFDALKGLGMAWGDRATPKNKTIEYVCFLERNKPTFWTMVKKRLWSRKVKI